MKLHILSDLHLEFGAFTPPPTDADVVVLAGDIHVKTNGLAWALKVFTKPVIYVPGNHEYYGGSLGHTLDKLKRQAAGTHVHILSDDELILDGVRFLGGTLWTDYRLTGNQPLAEWDAQQTMSDFKKIRNEQFSKVKPFQLAQRHARTRAFLESALEQEFSGKTVVVTHHAPSELSVHERYKFSGTHLNASYASRLDHLMGPNIALWAHGHTHDSMTYDLYGTQVVCNPRGYVGEELNEDFDPGLILEV